MPTFIRFEFNAKRQAVSGDQSSAAFRQEQFEFDFAISIDILKTRGGAAW
jgi:hypothetical protein